LLRFIFALALICTSIFSSQADEYRPAYLELQQTQDGIFDILWKVPARGAERV
jgi:hypothetical protein